MKHVTRACIGCQKRKTKCDGAKPQCANCALYRQTCTFSQEIDKRRLASKGKISTMISYIQALESLLLQHDFELPVGRPNDILPSVSTPPPVSIDDEVMIRATTRRASNHTVPSVGSGICTASDEVPSDLLSMTEDSLPGTNSMADRMGSLQIAEDGQLRFFGPTSNLHISHVGPFPLFNSNIRTVYYNENLILTAAGVAHEVDEELEDHLTKLYFTWENPNIPLVDEESYYEAKARYRKLNQASHRYSEVLNNAICAVGSALTSRYCPDLPESLVDFFATRSKALLEVEMDSPTLSTVQSLGILSGVEALLTRDARGWLYSGMAMRLATDLGLHIDAAPFAERGLIDLEEARLRSSTFWGTYTHERMWSLYVGRPESIDHLDITVQLPSAGDSGSDMNKKWRPYIDEDQQASLWESRALLNEVAQATVSICTKMASIRKVLYSTPRVNSPDINKLYAFAVKARNELDIWFSELPEVLAIDTNDPKCKHLPHVSQLHMQFHAVRIIVDQPFAFLSSGVDGLTAQDIQGSRETCNDAAGSITKIVQATRRHFSLRRVNIQVVHLIFTAMLVQVHSAFLLPDPQTRDTARRRLEICSQALGEIGQAYKNALRALEVITSIKTELLRREREATASGLQMINQPNSLSSMIALGQISSGIFSGNPGGSKSWANPSLNDEFLNAFDITQGLGTETFPSEVNQVSISGHGLWTPFTEHSVAEAYNRGNIS